MEDERLTNEPYNSWANIALNMVEDLNWKPEAKGDVLKLKTKGLILQNPLPGYDPRNREFTRSVTDAVKV